MSARLSPKHLLMGPEAVSVEGTCLISGPLIIELQSAQLGDDGLDLLRQGQCRIELFHLTTRSASPGLRSTSDFEVRLFR